jgi:hypothetical protein
MPICKAKECGEIIKFIELESGMKMPVNSKPESIIVIDDSTGKGKVIKGFKSHFATCPQAKVFRKKKRKC